MDFQIDGEMWLCYTCAHEEAGKGEQRNAPPPAPPRGSMKSDIPSAAMAGGEQKSEIQESAAPQETEFQKKCPMCGGRMDFQIDGEMWLCYTCAHEEAGQGKVQGKSAEKSEQRHAPEPTPALSRPPTKTKPCPACGKKMSFHESDKAWRCPHCEYERRI